MRPSVLASLVCVFGIAACDGNPHEAATTSGRTASKRGPPWVGRIEKLIGPPGGRWTHKLVLEDKTVVMLSTTKVDLPKYEGKRVEAKGPTSTAADEILTVMDVQEVEELR